MNSTRAYGLAAILFMSIPVTAGQKATQSAPSVQRDSNAVAVVQQAIQAMGGETGIKNIPNVNFQGSITNSPNTTGTYTKTWQAPPAPAVPTARAANSSATASKPTPTPTPAPTTVPFTPAFVATTLLTQLRSNAFSLQYAGQVVLGTNTATAVTFTFNPPTKLPPGTTLPSVPAQTWYFSIQTALPVRIEYKASGTTPSGSVQLQAIDFSDYRPVSGVLYPFNMVLHRSDQVNQTLTIQIVTPSPSAATSN